MFRSHHRVTQFVEGALTSSILTVVSHYDTNDAVDDGVNMKMNVNVRQPIILSTESFSFSER